MVLANIINQRDALNPHGANQQEAEFKSDWSPCFLSHSYEIKTHIKTVLKLKNDR